MPLELFSVGNTAHLRRYCITIGFVEDDWQIHVNIANASKTVKYVCVWEGGCKNNTTFSFLLTDLFF